MNETPATPRIAPGTRRDTGTLNYLIAKLIGLATGSGPPHVFTTLGRHRGLFRRWLIFAAGLMPRGKLPRIDSELVILRTAYNCRCAYELEHHRRLAAVEGLSTDEIRAAEGKLEDGVWSPRQAALLRATDELHAERRISDSTWRDLTQHLSDRKCIEFCLLVGHYEMLAMTLNSLGTPPDQFAEPSRAGRLLRRLAG